MLRARGTSDLLQRAESVIGAVALGLGVALVWTVLITPGQGWLVAHTAAVTGQSTVVGLWIIVAGWTYGTRTSADDDGHGCADRPGCCGT